MLYKPAALLGEGTAGLRMVRGQGVFASRPWALRGEPARLVLVDLAAVVVMTGPGRWTATLTAVAVTLPALAAARLYRPRLGLLVLDDGIRVPVAVTAAGAAASLLEAPPPAYLGAGSRAWLWWSTLTAGGLLLGRGFGYAVLRRRRRRARGEPTVVVGTGVVARRVTERLLSEPEYGLRPIGFLGSPSRAESDPLPLPWLGGDDQLAEVAAERKVRNAVVAFSASPDGELVEALRRCRHGGVTVFVVPRLFELSLLDADAELVDGVPLVRMPPPPPRRPAWGAKRALDVCGAVLGLVVLAPLLAICAVAVRWETGRDGVLFRQERVGRNGHRFRLLKFRSLTPRTGVESQLRWNIDDDTRVGPVGRLLRRTSLDELPQLINVLRGEMSLVGPRPERPFFVEQFRHRYAGYTDRHRVPTGITGWAQVHGLRGNTSISDRARYDNYYIENWSLGLDAKIMFWTVITLLRRG